MEHSLCRGLTGLRAYARAIDGDGVTTLAQAAQERLGEGGISEEVLPGRVWEVGCDYMELPYLRLS